MEIGSGVGVVCTVVECGDSRTSVNCNASCDEAKTQYCSETSLLLETHVELGENKAGVGG